MILGTRVRRAVLYLIGACRAATSRKVHVAARRMLRARGQAVKNLAEIRQGLGGCYAMVMLVAAGCSGSLPDTLRVFVVLHRAGADSRLLLQGVRIRLCARVAESADAPDLGSGGVTRGGSNPPSRSQSGCLPGRSAPSGGGYSRRAATAIAFWSAAGARHYCAGGQTFPYTASRLARSDRSTSQSRSRSPSSKPAPSGVP